MLADGTELLTTGKGVVWRMATDTRGKRAKMCLKVLVVPALATDLLSVSALLDRGSNVNTSNGKLRVVRAGRAFLCHQQEGLFVLPLTPILPPSGYTAAQVEAGGEQGCRYRAGVGCRYPESKRSTRTRTRRGSVRSSSGSECSSSGIECSSSGSDSGSACSDGSDRGSARSAKPWSRQASKGADWCYRDNMMAAVGGVAAELEAPDSPSALAMLDQCAAQVFAAVELKAPAAVVAAVECKAPAAVVGAAVELVAPAAVGAAVEQAAPAAVVEAVEPIAPVAVQRAVSVASKTWRLGGTVGRNAYPGENDLHNWGLRLNWARQC